MKNLTLTTLLLCSVYYSTTAQTNSPVQLGLHLHLDAANGFNSGPVAIWNDLSGNGNHLSSGGSSTNPVHVPAAQGLLFPAVRFDGIDDYMESSVPAKGWAFADNVTEATLFVVRVANTASNTVAFQGLANVKTLISISENKKNDNEFCLLSNWSLHHSSSGNFMYKDHPCYSSLPSNRPVVLTARLLQGSSTSDIGYYVNNSQSLNPATKTPGAKVPQNYASVDRMVVVGARYDYLNDLMEFFDGHIFEVLAYNRALTSAEIHSVNEWLMCKYDVKYFPNLCSGAVAPSCLPTGVAQQLADAGDILIYPNPTEGTVNVKTTGYGQFSVAVTDMMGRLLARKVVEANKTEQISLQGNTPGVYMLQVSGDDGKLVKTTKVMLQ